MKVLFQHLALHTNIILFSAVVEVEAEEFTTAVARDVMIEHYGFMPANAERMTIQLQDNWATMGTGNGITVYIFNVLT